MSDDPTTPGPLDGPVDELLEALVLDQQLAAALRGETPAAFDEGVAAVVGALSRGHREEVDPPPELMDQLGLFARAAGPPHEEDAPVPARHPDTNSGGSTGRRHLGRRLAVVATVPAVLLLTPTAASAMGGHLPGPVGRTLTAVAESLGLPTPPPAPPTGPGAADLPGPAGTSPADPEDPTRPVRGDVVSDRPADVPGQPGEAATPGAPVGAASPAAGAGQPSGPVDEVLPDDVTVPAPDLVEAGTESGDQAPSSPGPVAAGPAPPRPEDAGPERDLAGPGDDFDQGAREAANREKDARVRAEKAAREAANREKDARETAARERAARERAEKAAREASARAAAEKSARDAAAREASARAAAEKSAREASARAAREASARAAAEKAAREASARAAREASARAAAEKAARDRASREAAEKSARDKSAREAEKSRRAAPRANVQDGPAGQQGSPRD